jgi:hypothetical protein
MYYSNSLVIVVLISNFSAYTTRLFNLLQGLWVLRHFNNDIMFTQVAVDVAGKINVMGSGDGMSWRMKSG